MRWLFTAMAFCCFFVTHNIYAEATDKVSVQKISFTSSNGLEIIISKKSGYKAFLLNNPDRLVVDIENAEIEKSALNADLPDFVTSIRSGKQQDSARIVFDLKQKVSIIKSASKKTKDQEYTRIYFELSGVDSSNFAPHYQLIKANDKITNAKSSQNLITTIKQPVIVIDAGHGGKDPGTIGDYARTKEKNITLAYAKELKKLLDNTKFYKVYLTRDSDFFIPLRQRVEKARKLKADLFISLHANSIENSQTSGFSIYTLSEKSSDKQAELLAQKENRADIINGVNFSGASPDVMKTLIDLSQRDSMNRSSSFANIVIKKVDEEDIKVLQNSHRFAGFAVLTAPDITSVLIEIGYLSNREEEKQLNNLIYKRKMVASLTEAVNEFFHKTKKSSKKNRNE